MIGIDIGAFMSGIVVVESVFGWPGIGQLTWQAIQQIDIPIIMGVTLVSACAIVLGNLLADLAAPLIDPRISWIDNRHVPKKITLWTGGLGEPLARIRLARRGCRSAPGPRPRRPPSPSKVAP